MKDWPDRTQRCGARVPIQGHYGRDAEVARAQCSVAGADGGEGTSGSDGARVVTVGSVYDLLQEVEGIRRRISAILAANGWVYACRQRA